MISAATGVLMLAGYAANRRKFSRRKVATA
jgi:hypothetical protein